MALAAGHFKEVRGREGREGRGEEEGAEGGRGLDLNWKSSYGG